MLFFFFSLAQRLPGQQPLLLPNKVVLWHDSLMGNTSIYPLCFVLRDAQKLFFSLIEHLNLRCKTKQICKKEGFQLRVWSDTKHISFPSNPVHLHLELKLKGAPFLRDPLEIFFGFSWSALSRLNIVSWSLSNSDSETIRLELCSVLLCFMPYLGLSAILSWSSKLSKIVYFVFFLILVLFRLL